MICGLLIRSVIFYNTQSVLGAIVSSRTLVWSHTMSVALGTTAADLNLMARGHAAEFESLAAALAADPDRGLFDAVDVMVPSMGTLHETVGWRRWPAAGTCCLRI